MQSRNTSRCTKAFSSPHVRKRLDWAVSLRDVYYWSGFIARHKAHEFSPDINYKLTDFGLELIEPLEVLADWATEHEVELQQICDRRNENNIPQ